MKELYTITKTTDGRGGDQWNIYKDGQLVSFAFDEAYAHKIIDEMIRFPNFPENARSRFD